MARIIAENEFDEAVLKSTLPVMVDFFAAWCGPCKMIAPLIDELAAEYEGRAEVVKVDIDKCPGLARTYGVRSIPTLIFFKDGKAAITQVGSIPKDAMAAKIDSLL